MVLRADCSLGVRFASNLSHVAVLGVPGASSADWQVRFRFTVRSCWLGISVCLYTGRWCSVGARRLGWLSFQYTCSPRRVEVVEEDHLGDCRTLHAGIRDFVALGRHGRRPFCCALCRPGQSIPEAFSSQKEHSWLDTVLYGRQFRPADQCR